jgi:hypothetical protein
MFKGNQLSYYVAVSDLKKILKKIGELRRLDETKKRVGFSMLAVTANRIFEQGKDGNNSDIGTYSAAYIKQRQRKNWPSSTKVILQATRQMVNDWSLIVDGNSWGLGFKNSVNFEKATYVESTYKKDIFAHTDAEVTQFTTLFQNEVNRILNAN